MTKLEQDLKVGELYSKTNQFKRNLNITLNSIKRMFEFAPNSYLALSFGKQSLCLAHMIYLIKPDTQMFFLRSWESYYIHNYEEIIKQFTNIYPINLNIVYRDNVSYNNLTWKQTRDLGEKDIQTMVDMNLFDGVFMGLSKDESVARRITCSISDTGYKTIFQYKSGKYRCTPIQFWTVKDLSAYIAINNIPLLNAYHERGLETRTTARLTRNCAEMNGMVDLKKRDIHSYNIIVKRFPELSAKA